MTGRYKVFHTASPELFKHIHVILVRPEQSQNVGSAARAMANMGIDSPLRLVSALPILSILSIDAYRLARHAKSVLDNSLVVATLSEALCFSDSTKVLKVAITARVGSPTRPHPLWVQEALPMALSKLSLGEYSDLALVFGPESDGLSNEEVAACDWVVGIPSDAQYRSLNLAQAVMVCCYELRRSGLVDSQTAVSSHPGQPGQKARLIDHILEVAAVAGFVLPGDPHKMRPRLTQILSGLPNHLKDIKTLHGLLDQLVRSIEKRGPDYKGRFKKLIRNEAESERV